MSPDLQQRTTWSSHPIGVLSVSSDEIVSSRKAFSYVMPRIGASSESLPVSSS